MAQPTDNLKLAEVARQLNRSLEQVRRYVREGKLPAQKIGLQWFVSPQALNSFKARGHRASDVDILARARDLREEIRERVGTLNVSELLDQSRRNHP